jgi:GNAT superfamily N-acetyltransferase
MKSVTVRTDQITQEISRAFDYEFSGKTTFSPPEMPYVQEPFGIGLIVGPSGSGKSTLLAKFGVQKPIVWDDDIAVCSHFESAADASERLGAVGFNSIPSWLRPYRVLSTGEQFRADLARRLEHGAVIDEFTSVVDRTVAQACAHSLRRYVDKSGTSGLVFASCHYDVIEWLRPDWVFDTRTGKIAGRGSERRPEIKLEIVPCRHGAWSMFRQHHYLDGNINKSSRCWIALWGDTPVGFASAIAFPNANFRNAWREHRTVVLPDYQGFGLGVRISDSVAKIFASEGCRYFSKTAHPRMGEYRNNSPLWRATSKNGKERKDYNHSRKTKEDGHKMKHADRLCFSHEYVGDFTAANDNYPSAAEVAA